MKMRETSRDTDKKPCVNNDLTWANQIRLLTLNFQQLSATLGQGLIAAVLPAIQALNALMAKLIQAAETFRNFIYTLVGKKVEGSQKGIEQDFGGIGDYSTGLEDIGSAGDTAAGGLDDAASAAENLKDALSVLPFDQLNQLTSNLDSAGSGGSGGGTGGSGGGVGGLGGYDFDDLGSAFDDLANADVTPINEWARRIRNAFLDHDWDRLGDEIAWGINVGLQKIYDVINWKNVGPKIEAFTDAFTQTFNSLVDHINWDLLGRTVGAGLNTITNTVNGFVTGINWVNIGNKFSEGINGFVREVDWYALGDTIGNYFMISWDIFQGIVTGLEYEEIGHSIENGISAAINAINLNDIAFTLATGMNGIVTTAITIADDFDFSGFGERIGNSLNTFFNTFDFGSIGTAINKWVNGILDAIISFVDTTDWGKIGDQIGDFLAEIDFLEIGKKIGKAIWKAINAGFEIYEGMFETAPLETALLSLVGITKAVKSTNIKNFIKAIKNGLGTVKDFGKALGGSTDALESLQKTTPKVSKVVSTLRDTFSAFKTGVTKGNWLTGISSAFDNIRQSMSKTQKGVVTAVSAFAEFSVLKDTFKDLITGSGDLGTNIAELAVTAGTTAASMYAALGPAGLVVSAVTGLISLFKGIDDAMQANAESSAIGQFSDRISQLSEEVSQTSEKIRESISGSISNIESAGYAEAEVARSLATEYENLSGKTTLTADEQSRLYQVSQSLVELVPGLNEYLDEQTGILDVQNGILHQLIDNQELYAKQQAAQEMLTDAYKQQYEAAYALSQAQTEYNQAAEEFINNHSGLSDRVKEMVRAGDIEGLRELNEEVQNGNETLNEFGTSSGITAGKMITLLEDAVTEWNSAMDDATQAQKDADYNLKNVQDTLNEVNTELSTNQKKLIESKKATNEFQQALRDINTSFDNMGLNISEQFAETLALDTGGATESIIGYFEQLKNQTQLSSDELKDLFSNIAPGMSDGFISSLSEQEPNIQAQVALIMANISAGAKVSSEDIKTVFSNIGYNIPDSIINSITEKEPNVQMAAINLINKLAEGYGLTSGSILELFSYLGINLSNELVNNLSSQEPNVQQAAISLLSQLESGKTLTEDQLVYSFQALGIGIANDGIISSLANAESSVQQQAIELLGQIQSAAEDERKPLIDKFNSLGIGTVNEGLLNTLDGLSDDAKEKAINLISQLGLAGDEKKGEIYDELEKVGIDAGTGLLDGMGEKTRDVSDIGMEWAEKAIDGAKTGFDSHSPSRKMRDVGRDAGDGLVKGGEDRMPVVRSTFIKMANQAINGLQHGFDSGSWTIHNMIQNVVNTMRSMNNALWNAGYDAGQSFANGFQSVHIPTPHLYVSSWSNQDLGNNQSMSVPRFDVDWYAIGGLFQRPTIAGIGEKGREAVLPLENRRTMGMIADSILGNGKFGIDEETMTNAVARGVAIAMMNNQGNQPNITVYAELKTEDDEVLARAVTRGQRKMDYRMHATPQMG